MIFQCCCEIEWAVPSPSSFGSSAFRGPRRFGSSIPKTCLPCHSWIWHSLHLGFAGTSARNTCIGRSGARASSCKPTSRQGHYGHTSMEVPHAKETPSRGICTLLEFFSGLCFGPSFVFFRQLSSEDLVTFGFERGLLTCHEGPSDFDGGARNTCIGRSGTRASRQDWTLHYKALDLSKEAWGCWGAQCRVLFHILARLIVSLLPHAAARDISPIVEVDDP